MTPFGMAELFLLVLACGAAIGVSLALTRKEVDPPTRSFAVVAATIVVAFALWQMHDPEIPFGTDEAVLLAVASVSACVAGLRRKHRP